SRLSALRPIPPEDGLLAATAHVHRLTPVTRNTKNAEGQAVSALNRWIGNDDENRQGCRARSRTRHAHARTHGRNSKTDDRGARQTSLAIHHRRIARRGNS